MFIKSERYYDAIYAWKDYKSEAARLAEIVSASARTSVVVHRRKKAPGSV